MLYQNIEVIKLVKTLNSATPTWDHCVNSMPCYTDRKKHTQTNIADSRPIWPKCQFIFSWQKILLCQETVKKGIF